MRILATTASWAAVQLAHDLQADGLFVTRVDSWDDLQHLVRTATFDAVLLADDVPDCPLGGVSAALRLLSRERPGLVLAARGDRLSSEESLAAGADLVSGPGEDSRLLSARLKAAVLRAAGHAPPVARASGVGVDVIAREVRLGRDRLALSPLQYQIVERLVLNRGRAVSREALLDALYGWENEPGGRVLDTFLHDIRRRVRAVGGDPGIFQTRRGEGFRLATPIRESA
ncbi:winged helix-turn-helix transcriptional regulator [Histidinibacterium aquaticum]|uniref:Response regulator transcription factor n=1 Tax=Histidinibacterium aquaticum TaxID=2613962 RepID=A0A5J5GL52_9RHOB|nr:response regulator transcription factor [Histidinibacterium aquaticum]KAA9008202.1 response regulator transcription factor [Histidinibacterium aquaticum]